MSWWLGWSVLCFVVARLAADRRLDAGVQRHGAQVDVLVQLEAELQEDETA